MPRRTSIENRRADLPGAWQDELSDESLGECAGEAVFARGFAYFEQGKVRLVRDGGGNASFKVKGTQTYDTELYFEDDMLHVNCSCPHAQDGAFCKHMVASGLAWRTELAGEATPDNAQGAGKTNAAAKHKSTAMANREALRGFVLSQSAPVLAERLWAWAEMDRELMADLKAWAAQSRATGDPKALKSVLSDLLKSSGFLDWRDSSVYARRAEKVLPLLERTLVSDPVLTREACDHALRRLYRACEHADDSGGDIGGVVYALMDLLLRAVRAVPPPAAWVEDWFSLMVADPWGLWSEAAVLDAAGPAVQQRYSQRVARDWEAWVVSHPPTAVLTTAVGGRRAISTVGLSGSYDHERSQLRRRYLNDLERRGDSQAKLDAMRTSLNDASEHCELVAYCETLGRMREALQFAQAAYKRHPTDWRVEESLLRCYDRDGWDKEALALRRHRLEKSPTAERYRAVLATAQAAGLDVEQHRVELFAWAEGEELKPPTPVYAFLRRNASPASQGRHVGTRVEWLLADEKLDEALALVQPPHVCQPALLHAIAEKLPAARNAEAVPLLLRVFEVSMRGASSPYREPLALVAQTAARMGSQERRRWLVDLRAQYKAKRNFIKELPDV